MKQDIKLNEVLRDIRAHCLECSGGVRSEVENCHIKTCNLYKYRNVGALGLEAPQKPTVGQIGIFDDVMKEVKQNERGKRGRRS